MGRPIYWPIPEEPGKWRRGYFITSEFGYNLFEKAIREDEWSWRDEFMGLIHHYFLQEPHYGALREIFEGLECDDVSIGRCEGLAMGMQDFEAKDIASLMQVMTLEQRQLLLSEFPFGVFNQSDQERWDSFIKCADNDASRQMQDYYETMRGAKRAVIEEAVKKYWDKKYSSAKSKPDSGPKININKKKIWRTTEDF